MIKRESMPYRISILKFQCWSPFIHLNVIIFSFFTPKGTLFMPKGTLDILAIQAVSAMEGSPLSARLVFPARSPRLLPQAMSVRPMTLSGTCSSWADRERMPTT